MLCIGGLMMGQTTDDLDAPITKTATGVVILPRDHHVMERKLKPNKVQAKIGKSACDQCRYCTEYCPRFLLGYAVEPHQVMRSLAFTATGAEYWNQWAAMCCSCGLCTLFACPEELYPKEACDDSKAEMRRTNVKWTGPTTVKPHAMRDGRHVPIKTLTRKLNVHHYDLPAPLWTGRLEPSRLVLPLKQSAGTPCQPKVKVGDRVTAGQLIAEPAANALGANLHAPLAGTGPGGHQPATLFSKGNIMEKSIGLIELSSVAAGFEVADTMLKAGNVRLLLSRSICSGKYMVLIGGDTAAVEAAVTAGAEAANGCLIDQFVISNVHPEVLVALGRTQPVQPDGALGILESFNVATLIEAADAAAKAANVTLLEVRLAMALGGKAFCTMTGDVASVQAAVAAGRQVISEAGVLVNAVVISRPHPDVYREVI